MFCFDILLHMNISQIEKEVISALEGGDTLVFPTQLSADSWEEWAIFHSKFKAVAAERFLPWDVFAERILNGKSFSPAKRTKLKFLQILFCASLIEENKNAPIFTKIIPLRLRETSASLAVSLSKTLSKVGELFAYNSLYLEDSPEGEARDYFVLHKKYEQFLEEISFHEDDTNVKDDGKFVVFFPEANANFYFYKEKIASSPHFRTVSAEPAEDAKVYEFTDSFSELRFLMLRIRDKATGGEAAFNEMAISVKDVNLFRPYLERFASEYEVPLIFRCAAPLLSEAPFFALASACYTSDFSFRSVRDILLSEQIAYRAEFSELRKRVVFYGVKFRCLTGMWKEAFRKEGKTEELEFFRVFESDIKILSRASSFSALLASYFIFKEHFLLDGREESAFAREIDILATLSRLEALYFKGKIKNPFEIFLAILRSSLYQKREERGGVSVFDYETAAAFKCKFHFVIAASQRNLSVKCEYFDFLPKNALVAFHLDEGDEEREARFISMYDMCGENQVSFSYAINSFEGFALPHSALCIKKMDEKEESRLSASDFVEKEKDALKGEKTPAILCEWQKASLLKVEEKSLFSPSTVKLASVSAASSLTKWAGDSFCFTQSDMKNFFPCPRKWLFSNVFFLTYDLDIPKILFPYEIGSFFHTVMEILLRPYKEKRLLISSVTEGNEEEIKLRVKESVMSVLEQVKGKLPPLAFSVLEKSSLSSERIIFDFVKVLFNEFSGKMVKALEAALHKDFDKWKLYGKIDAIFEDEEKLFIVDYKTSSLPKMEDAKSKEGVLKDFQLALYTYLAQEKFGEETDGSFFSIKEKKKSASLSNQDKKAAQSVLFSYIPYFYERVKAGDFTVSFPREAPFCLKRSDCVVCKYRAVCRTVYKNSSEGGK